jgi:hypothetical protein
MQMAIFRKKQVNKTINVSSLMYDFYGVEGYTGALMMNLSLLHTHLPKAISAVSLVFVALSANAQLAVSWGPSNAYVTSHTNSQGLVGGQVVFSDTVAINPVAPYPNGQPSGTYYGGSASTSTSGITYWRILNNIAGNNSNDALSFASDLAPGNNATTIYLWNKADFLNGFDTGSTQITGMSAYAYHTGASASTLSGSVRWLVKVGSDYYVSEAYATATTLSHYEITDMASVDWFSLTPSTSMTAIGAQWMAPDFSNVEAVGIWQQTLASGTVNAAQGLIGGFEVAAIPEPGQSALYLTGIVVTLMFIRRRRK